MDRSSNGKMFCPTCYRAMEELCKVKREKQELLNEVIKILEENYHPDSGQYYDREYIHADVIEEIEALGGKK